MSSQSRSAELHPGPGFRIKSKIERPSRELIEEVRNQETPDVADMMNRLYAMNVEIKNRVNGAGVCGPACTVKVYPGDNLMVHRALDIAQPGDIIVVDAGGSRNNALVGDLVCTKAKQQGIQGFVIDGLIRDLPGIRAVGMPIYCRGITPIGPFHRGPGEINFAISCGGIAVNPGDIILGDSNGVVVIPRESAADVIEKVKNRQRSQKDYADKVRRGEFSNKRVDAILEANHCLYVD